MGIVVKEGSDAHVQDPGLNDRLDLSVDRAASEGCPRGQRRNVCAQARATRTLHTQVHVMKKGRVGCQFGRLSPFVFTSFPWRLLTPRLAQRNRVSRTWWCSFTFVFSASMESPRSRSPAM